MHCLSKVSAQFHYGDALRKILLLQFNSDWSYLHILNEIKCVFSLFSALDLCVALMELHEEAVIATGHKYAWGEIGR